MMLEIHYNVYIIYNHWTLQNQYFTLGGTLEYHVITINTGTGNC